MASTPVQIANRALARLGVRAPISDINEQSAEAAYVRAFYDDVLRETLALLDWRFAARVVSLAGSGAAPQPWLGQFALPADCLTVRGLCETWNVATVVDYWSYPPSWWMRADRPSFAVGLGTDTSNTAIRALWCNLTAPVLRYTAVVEDASLWDAEFGSSFAFALAAEIALPLTGKGELRQAMLQGRSDSLSQAATNSAQGATRIEQHTPDWLAVRG